MFLKCFILGMQPISPPAASRSSQGPDPFNILTTNNIFTPASLLDASSVSKPVMLLSRFIRDKGETPSKDDQDLILKDMGKALSFIRSRVGADVPLTDDRIVVQVVRYR